MSQEIFVSYIIPTIGRSSLEVAVKSVLTQELPDAAFEIIVVNDSGNPLQKADWQTSPRVKTINTNKSERSFARNCGAAIAKGRYLAFLDDDDWILTGALESFWQLANRYPNAAWLYGGIRIVDEQGGILAEINSGLTENSFAQIMGGAWAPIQASLIKARSFFDAGGYNPFVCGTEDEDLCRRIAYFGDIANTPEIVACLYRGQTWSTSTNYLRAPEDTKYSRDLILAKPHVIERLLASADSSYWYGRILRVYLSTVTWNLKQRRLFAGLSRILSSLVFFALSLRYLFSKEYWKGIRAHHIPDTLHFVMKDIDQRHNY